MVNDARWLLPDGVEEILPDEAIKLEMLRRNILDDLASRDFKLVMPPVMEFVDSLLTGTGKELDTQTYKFMDQHTHRMLGIRADMTPQIARLDAHYLADQKINRLCYSGSVLRTQPNEVGGQRELLQIGAELFGEQNVSADIEIIEAMLASLQLSGAEQITLSLGHVGLYEALLTVCEVPEQLEPHLFDTLLRKSAPDLRQLSRSDLVAPGSDLSAFETLLNLQGDLQVIATARSLLPDNPAIKHSLQQLQTVVEYLSDKHTEIRLHIDLADVFGYRYHTGLKFFAYVNGRSGAIAKGGRYDSIGEQFGRARPATGFSADLKALVKMA